MTVGPELVGALGVGLNQIFIWPQVRRALVSVEGVAAMTVLGGLLARTTWFVYGVSLDDVLLILGNVTVAAGFLVLLGLLLRRAEKPLTLLAGAGAVGVLVAAAALGGGTVLGWFAVFTAAVVNLPQMVRALIDPERLSGVSVPTYLLVAAASICWLSYGLLVDEPLISAPHVLLLPSALITAWVAGRSQRRQAG